MIAGALEVAVYFTGIGGICSKKSYPSPPVKETKAVRPWSRSGLPETSVGAATGLWAGALLTGELAADLEPSVYAAGGG